MKKYMLIISLLIIALIMTVMSSVSINQPTESIFTYVKLYNVVTPSKPKITTVVKQEQTDFFNGICFYPAPLPYDSEESVQSLSDLLLEMKANFIGLRYFLHEQNLESNAVYFDAHQDEVLFEIISQIHEAGKGVCLEPQILIDSPGQYVADLKPKSVKEWFENYQKVILHYAQFAQNCGVEIFSVANENNSLWGYSQYWNNLINSVSNIYKGNITVRLNCWWQEKTYQSIINDYIWLENSNLTYIGISPYFDLTLMENPEVEDLVKAWISSESNRHNLNIVEELENISNRYKKKILFLEIGYRSIELCASEPWNASDVVPRGSKRIVHSNSAPVIAVKALYRVFGNKEWFAGVFWFYWPTAKPAKADTTWSIWTKPIQEILNTQFAAH